MSENTAITVDTNQILEFPLVMIVDDRKEILEIIAQYAGTSNCSIIRFLSPKKALAFCQKYPGLISILITDVEMEKLTGPELAEALTPDLWAGGKKTIIFTTGNAVEAEKLRKQEMIVIEKPIIFEDFYKIFEPTLAALVKTC